MFVLSRGQSHRPSRKASFYLSSSWEKPKEGEEKTRLMNTHTMTNKLSQEGRSITICERINLFRNDQRWFSTINSARRQALATWSAFFPSPLVEKSHLYRASTWKRFVRLINSIWTTALIARTEWNALARKLMCFVRLAYWSSSAGFIITSTDDAPSDGHF